MTDLSELNRTVLESIKQTEEYRVYLYKLKELKNDENLYIRVNEMREKNFLLQQANSEEVYDLMDALTNEYEDVINIELVSEFLEAEAALCRLIQNFNRELIEGLEFD